ncbi:MAG: pentapeptide repeat-containing protein [Planctomycetota bacterium]|nr:pentapeptide repeat-containing protein [Planctomycetota bacterium]
MEKPNQIEQSQAEINASIWNHAVPICSVIIAGLSAFLAYNSSQTAKQAIKLQSTGNEIQVDAVGEFALTNKIAKIAAIRDASVNARMLFEDPKYSVNGMDFSHLRFSTYRFPKKDMQRCDFSSCNLSWALLKGARMGGTSLVEANLWGADLERAEFWGARFEKADLRDARAQGINLRGANLEKSLLQGCDLRGADLRGASLKGATLGILEVKNLTFKGEASHKKGEVVVNLKKCTDLRGANLTGANMEECAVEHVLYDDKTAWPAGFTPPASFQQDHQK